MAKYETLLKDLHEQINTETVNASFVKVGFDEKSARRRFVETDTRGWYTPFASDINKIMHSSEFSRYADKTQVFSLFKNDDMTRRSLHVQLVSRIARTIGSALHLNSQD